MTKADMTAAEAGLAALRAHREFAERLEDYAPTQARAILTTVERVEDVMRPRLSAWMTLAEVKRHTGWSTSHLRNLCPELEERSLARKSPHWEIKRSAVGRNKAIEPKPDHESPVIDADDIRATARRLARGGK